MPIYRGGVEVVRIQYRGVEVDQVWWRGQRVFTRQELPDITEFVVTPDHNVAGSDPVTPTLSWQQTGGTHTTLTDLNTGLLVLFTGNQKLIEPAVTRDTTWRLEESNLEGSVHMDATFLYNVSGANVANFTAGAVQTHQGPNYERGQVALAIGITGHPFPTLTMALPSGLSYTNQSVDQEITEANAQGTVVVGRYLRDTAVTDTLTLVAENRYGGQTYRHSRTVTIVWPRRASA